MLHSLLRIGNFYWDGGSFRPPLDLADEAASAATLPRLHGQFGLAAVLPEGEVVLARDKLGINKLFLAIQDSGRVLVSNYLADLVAHGAPIDAIHSIPAGHLLQVDVARERVCLRRYVAMRPADAATTPIPDLARTIRARLEVWMSRLAAAFAERPIRVCLSGGLDSSLIAALARKHFSHVTAYTYDYAGEGEDVRYAERVAASLGIPLRLVPASAADVLAVLDEALCYGQDWRAFNVHCAIVNALLARAISGDAGRGDGEPRPLVLTGDLMNEFLADYAPVRYRGQEYYKLPRLPPGRLRAALIRGLDAGDREVGIFNHYGIDVIQPYGLVVDDYLRLPSAFVANERCKQVLVREIAGDLLPSFLFDRQKVRAQIGTTGEPTGILPVLADAQRDAGWLRGAFCRLFRIEEEAALERLVRLGVYRFPNRFPSRSSHGYLC
jgi:asparagine synthetase B (glutamine-hydrolysing)